MVLILKQQIKRNFGFVDFFPAIWLSRIPRSGDWLQKKDFAGEKLTFRQTFENRLCFYESGIMKLSSKWKPIIEQNVALDNFAK